MTEDTTTRDATPQLSEDQDFGLLDLLVILAKHKMMILWVTGGATLAAIIVSFLLPNIYKSTAKILPPQQNQSAAMAMLAQLGTQVGGLAGMGSGALGIRNPNDLYVGMLKSRTVADTLIDRFELKKVYGEDTYFHARQELEKKTAISAGRDNIIKIEVGDNDPKRAAAIANGYVEELYKLTQTLAITEASQRRLFFERQLDQARKHLASAEATARQGLEKGGLVIVDAQGRAMVETTARLRGQIAVKEIQISAMRAFAAERNPDLQQAQHELDAMKRELGKMEGTASVRGSAGSPGKSGGMDNLGLLRDVRYYEVMFELLAKQFELAKIDEAREASLIQVLDRAVESERKSSPRRGLIMIVTALVASILAVLWAFFSEARENARRNPAQASRLEALRGHMRWR